MTDNENAVQYIKNFFERNYDDFFEAQREYTSRGYENFKNNHRDISNCIFLIVGEMENSYKELIIPGDFPTFQSLLSSIERFSINLSKQDNIFEDAINHYPIDSIPIPIIEINKIRNNTIEACNHYIVIAKRAIKKEELKNKSEDINMQNNKEKKGLKEIWENSLLLKLGTAFGAGLGMGFLIFNVVFAEGKDLRDEKINERNVKIEKLTSQLDAINKENKNYTKTKSIFSKELKGLKKIVLYPYYADNSDMDSIYSILRSMYIGHHNISKIDPPIDNDEKIKFKNEIQIKYFCDKDSLLAESIDKYFISKGVKNSHVYPHISEDVSKCDTSTDSERGIIEIWLDIKK